MREYQKVVSAGKVCTNFEIVQEALAQLPWIKFIQYLVGQLQPAIFATNCGTFRKP